MKQVLLALAIVLSSYGGGGAQSARDITFRYVGYDYTATNTPENFEDFQVGERIHFQWHTDREYHRSWHTTCDRWWAEEANVSCDGDPGTRSGDMNFTIGGKSRTADECRNHSAGGVLSLSCWYEVQTTNSGEICIGNDPFADRSFYDTVSKRLVGEEYLHFPDAQCIEFGINRSGTPGGNEGTGGDDSEPDPQVPVKPERKATLLNLSPWQAWVHLYCQKDRPTSDADTVNPCTVRFECNGMSGEPASWTVDVPPKTIFSYWPNKTVDGMEADLQAALMEAGKTEEEARRRTTCEVFSPDPVAVRGYTLFGEQPTLIPVTIY